MADSAGPGPGGGGDGRADAWPSQPSLPPTVSLDEAGDPGLAPTEPERWTAGPPPSGAAPTTPYFHDIEAPGAAGVVDAGAPVFGQPAYGQPAYPPPPYGYGGAYGPYAYGGGYAPPRNNGLAVASLVCGICAFVVCQIVAIPGLILGLRARRQIRESGGAETGDAFALAGIVLSAIGLFLLVALVVVYAAIIIVAANAGP